MEAAKLGLVEKLRTDVASAGPGPSFFAVTPPEVVEKPKIDLAAMQQRIKEEKKKEASNFEAMRLKLLGGDDDDDKPQGKTAGKKAKAAKGKGKSQLLQSSLNKVDSLRSEVAASKGDEASGVSTTAKVAEEASKKAAEDAAKGKAAEETAVAKAAEVVAKAKVAEEVAKAKADEEAAAAKAAAAKAAHEAAAAKAAEEAAKAKAVEEVAAAEAAAARATEEAAAAKAAEQAAAAKATEEAEAAKAATANPVAPKVYVRYNHKNKLFPVVDGRLDFSLVDADYCLSYVLKGGWSCRLKHAALGEILLDGGRLRMGNDDAGDPVAHGTFSGLRLQDDDGKGNRKEAQYALEVQQDQSIASAPREAYKGSGASGTGMGREGSRKEGCSCLYGNPCGIPDFCKDWHNRFEVAKRNGGKGFPSVAL